MSKMKDSGIKWIGDIPKEWGVGKVSFFYDITLGKMVQPYQTLDTDTMEHYLCAVNLGHNRLKLNDLKQMWINKQEKDTLQLKKGDLIVVEGGDIASCDIVPFDLDNIYFQNSVMRVRGKDGNDNRILRYLLIFAKARGYIDLICNKATIAHFTKEKLSSLQIPIIPISEQRTIANFLDSKCADIDALTSDIESQIDMLEQYKRSVITEAVTKGLNQDVEMKDSGVEWIGKIPASWNVHPIYYYFEERKNKNSLGTETNLLSLSYGKIIHRDINSNSGLVPESFNTYNIVEPGDIIIRPTDLQNDKRSLRTGLVTEHGIITSAYIDLKAIKPINTTYYHYLLHAFDVMKVFYNMGNGVRQGLNFSELSKLMVFEPSRDEQEAIADYLDEKCSNIDAILEGRKAELATLKEYKKSLIYEYVTGKKEVPMP